MAELVINSFDAIGETRRTRVEIELVRLDGERIVAVAGFHGDASVVFPRISRTDQDGVLSVDLVPNEEITPAGTFYRVQISDMDRRHMKEFFVLKDDTTQGLLGAIVEPLEPLTVYDGGTPSTTSWELELDGGEA